MDDVLISSFFIFIHSIPSFIGYKILKNDIKNNKNLTLGISFLTLSIIPIVTCFYILSDIREYGVLSFVSGPIILLLCMIGIIIHSNKTNTNIQSEKYYNQKLYQANYKKFKLKDFLIILIILFFIRILIF